MKYSLGLDIGTTSIGWVVANLDKQRIEDAGVRIFERPENPKNGKSLSEPRRTGRSARRRLRRRRQRLEYLKKFFVDNNLLSQKEIETALTPHKEAQDPYTLREKGTDAKLENDEIFIALYHIAKRRGYKSNSKAQDEDVLKRIAEQKEKFEQKKDSGKIISKSDDRLKVLSAVYDNRNLLIEYGTIAKVLNSAEKFNFHKRNKADSYQGSFMRDAFEDEARKILHKQRELGLQLSDEKIEELLHGGSANIRDDGIIITTHPGIFYQRPFMNAQLINGMRGKDFYNGEDRAPKASLTFELFRLAEDIAHIKNAKNPEWQISREQGDAIVAKAKNTKKVTYGSIREILGFKNKYREFDFGYIRGKNPDVKKIKNYESMKPEEKMMAEMKEREKATFVQMEFYHAISTALKEFPAKFSELENYPDLFDKLGEILTTHKDDFSASRSLNEIGFSDIEIKQLLLLNFTKFGNLSLTTMRKAIPLMLTGKTYDKALEEIYPGKFASKLSGDKTKLPSLNKEEQDQITNPVVKRAISQTIKVINAVILKYGAPTNISIECANELAKDFGERNDIKKQQDENAVQNEKIFERLKNEFGVMAPTGLQITKFKFFLEQDDKCLYCGQGLDINRLFIDEHYGEIDHIIPFSICGNDGRVNKALVCTNCNQNKQRNTPYQAWGGDCTKWTEFEARINGNPKIRYGKKQRLLAKTIPKEDWNARALHDTRYITRFISQFVRNNLNFNDEGDGKQKVITPTGGITSYLRRMWRVGVKNRDESNLHHATDAAIVALVNQGIIQECSTYSKWTELGAGSLRFQSALAKISNPETGEIIDEKAYIQLRDNLLPWPNFDKEVRLRTSQIKDGDDLATWRDQFRDLYREQDSEFRESIHPIFVSRMPKRNGTGSTNDATIRSPRGVNNKNKVSYYRTRLSNVTLEKLENSATKKDDTALYKQLKALLLANDNDPLKAFSKPVYKNSKTRDKNGLPISPVSTIKVDDSANIKSGFLINDKKQFVNNGNTVCLNIYAHKKGVFAAPVYMHLIHAKELPLIPTPNGRSRNEKEFWQKLSAKDNKVYATPENGFTKLSSIYPNDYVKIRTISDEFREGYYVKFGAGSGNMVLISHTASSKDNHKHINIGVGTIREIQRLDISVLGNNYEWQ